MHRCHAAPLRPFLLLCICLTVLWAGQAPAERVIRYKEGERTYIITDPELLTMFEAMSKQTKRAAKSDEPNAEELFMGSTVRAVVDAKGRTLMEIRRSGEVVFINGKEMAVPPEITAIYAKRLTGNMKDRTHQDMIAAISFHYVPDGDAESIEAVNLDERNLAVATRLVARIPKPVTSATRPPLREHLTIQFSNPIKGDPDILYVMLDASAMWADGMPVELDDAMRADLKTLIDYATPLVVPKKTGKKAPSSK